MDIIADLTRVLRARRDADPETSYVASLYQKGTDKILEKVGEEATEVLLAAKNLQFAQNQELDATERPEKALVGEVADLWFHSMVMMVQLDIDPAAVLQTLEDRHGVSGHTEKASRDD